MASTGAGLPNRCATTTARVRGVQVTSTVQVSARDRRQHRPGLARRQWQGGGIMLAQRDVGTMTSSPAPAPVRVMPVRVRHGHFPSRSRVRRKRVPRRCSTLRRPSRSVKRTTPNQYQYVRQPKMGHTGDTVDGDAHYLAPSFKAGSSRRAGAMPRRSHSELTGNFKGWRQRYYAVRPQMSLGYVTLS
jgi:hypothetical protein